MVGRWHLNPSLLSRLIPPSNYDSPGYSRHDDATPGTFDGTTARASSDFLVSSVYIDERDFNHASVYRAYTEIHFFQFL